MSLRLKTTLIPALVLALVAGLAVAATRAQAEPTADAGASDREQLLRYAEDTWASFEAMTDDE
ncbi:MAG TPA: hypothetical protein VK919_05665, partial [Solirubrobacterales bacterium]|nr:hypothetical protein [Solirubrobacterales bacterium]